MWFSFINALSLICVFIYLSVYEIKLIIQMATNIKNKGVGDINHLWKYKFTYYNDKIKGFFLGVCIYKKLILITFYKYIWYFTIRSPIRFTLKINPQPCSSSKQCFEIVISLQSTNLKLHVFVFQDSLEISMSIYDHTKASRRSIHIFATCGQ